MEVSWINELCCNGNQFSIDTFEIVDVDKCFGTNIKSFDVSHLDCVCM